MSFLLNFYFTYATFTEACDKCYIHILFAINTEKFKTNCVFNNYVNLFNNCVNLNLKTILGKYQTSCFRKPTYFEQTRMYTIPNNQSRIQNLLQKSCIIIKRMEVDYLNLRVLHCCTGQYMFRHSYINFNKINV